MKVSDAESVHTFYSAAPGGVPTQTAFSQNRRFAELDLDREKGVIRSAEHAYSKDGGLAVLFGNIALDGCIVKTAGVDASILTFSGPPASSRARTRRWTRSSPTRSRPATWWSSATRVRAAAPACRKCSIRRAT